MKTVHRTNPVKPGKFGKRSSEKRSLKSYIKSITPIRKEVNPIVNNPRTTAEEPARRLTHEDFNVRGSFGQWEVGAYFSEGTTGRIFWAKRKGEECTSPQLLKVALDPSKRDAIRNEALGLSKLNHPNIVCVLDFGGIDSEETEPWLVKQFHHGQSLREGDLRTKLSDLELMEIFQKVYTAVVYAHRTGVEVRDYDPRNILLTEDGPIMIDFDRCHIVNDFTRYNRIPDNFNLGRLYNWLFYHRSGGV